MKKLNEMNIQVYSLAPAQSHGDDNEENIPEITATLLVAHTTTTAARSTWISTRTIYRISKISPGTLNPFVVLVVVNTGNVRQI